MDNSLFLAGTPVRATGDYGTRPSAAFGPDPDAKMSALDK